MAYSFKNSKGEIYYLHRRQNAGETAKGEIYYFSKDKKGGDIVESLPDGFKVIENENSGLPVLKKI